MQRRNALKNIGLSVGGFTMSATVVGLMQGCKAEVASSTWQPKFFSLDESDIVSKTLEVILPSSDEIPGAIELNLTQFIDGYIHEVVTEKERNGFKAGVEEYLATTLEVAGKNKSKDLSAADIEERLAFYLKADSKKQNAWDAEVRSALRENGATPSRDAVNFSVLKSLRQRGISAFKGSEFIGENVLAYDPIPGMQIGCVDLQETTQGKAWSL